MGQFLFLNRLVVHPSDKVIDVTFRKGLNIVLAVDVGTDTAQTRNSVGKSTFINLINYGLGSSNFLPNDKKAAKARMQKFTLYLQFAIGEQKYTIQRSLVETSQYIQLYSDWVIDDLLSGVEVEFEHKSIEDYRTFLETELFESKNLYNGRRILSWRQIAPLLIRDQVGGFQELSQPMGVNEKAEVRRKRIEFLLNLLTTEKQQLEEKKEAEHVLMQEKHKAYSVIRQYSERKVDFTEIELSIEIQRIEQLITDTLNEIDKFKQELINLYQYNDDAKQTRDNLSQELLKINNDIVTHRDRIENYSATINEIHGELQKVEVASSAAQLLNRFDYKQCPTCLRPFTSEVEGKNCSHSVYRASEETVNLIKTVLKNESRELVEATTVHQKEIDLLTEKKTGILDRIKLIDADLNLDVRGILELIKYQENELNQYRLDYAHLVNLQNVSEDVKTYYKEWQDEKEKFEGTSKLLRELNQKVEDRITSFKFLVNEVVEFLYNGSRTGILNQSVRAGNFSVDIRHKEHNQGVDDGAAAFTIRVIAFDLALLKLAILSDTNHPKFLVHDSPNVRDIDPIVYKRIFGYILNLENDLVAEGAELDFQYIITTIDIPDELIDSEYVRLTLDNTGERGKLFGFSY
ncbi:DUF2326 domain-containing protein [Paenibacillus sp. ISL-20]|uniref:DUF2326 domain-containing protein n=1 Tax=Paenibacillus sp. ISL-20 TaxID=2819163 RepID=UPI001BE9DCE2|nr:DUF2326 domain-containing protein [Paenibacillus sp. ISL-20]MBT2764811.1 DUF2326 domain-containing protein [Paenibacillus sp. ISL-20]